MLIDQGQKRLHMSVSDLKELAIGLQGKTDILDELTKDKEIFYKESIGKDSSYFVVKNDFQIQSCKRRKGKEWKYYLLLLRISVFI